MTAPISLADVERARDRLAPYLVPTPLRQYPTLDAAIPGATLFVKHENTQPTGSFKVRNGLASITALGESERARGIVGASTGNHGQGLAYAGAKLGAPVTICVPLGNNPEKNAAMRGWGATVVEEGADYDESIATSLRLAAERGLTLCHSTNNVNVLAGAGTMTLEILAEASDLDVLLIAIGGGSQAVGAITVARALRPSLRVIGVQAAGAPAGYESWKARERLAGFGANTFAEGVATRSAYDLTFAALVDGLADFVTVTDAEIADAVRLILATTHHLVEGSGALGVAAAVKLRDQLQGQRVGVVFSGGNMDSAVLRRILNREL